MASSHWRQIDRRAHRVCVCVCRYAAVANLLSAALQGVAIFLEVVGKGRWAKAVELVDKLVLALTSTAAPLLLAVDDIGSPAAAHELRRQQA